MNFDLRNHRPPFDIIKYGKVPPQSVDLEMAILGAMMIDSNAISVGMSRIFPEIFYKDDHKKIFTAIQQLYDKNKKIDLLTVIDQTKKNDDLDSIGGMAYLTKLTRDVTSGANIDGHISIVAENYLKRESIRLSGELMTDSYEEGTDAFDIINIADAGFQKIQEQVLTGMAKDISSFGMKVLEQHATVKATGVLGISTGIKSIDSAICGLVEPDLIVVAARPGQGKTSFALSITHNTSVIGDVPCAWFSLEMDGTQLVRRLASIDSDIPHERIRKGQTTTEEDKLIGVSIEKISSSKIYIEDRASINTRYIRTRAHLLKKRHGIKYIVVDYLQLMSGLDPKNKNREQVVSEISRDLKMIAKELEMPVIALSQLSREVEKRANKMPQLSDLRESGAIEQDADEVIFLMRPEYYQMTEPVQIGFTEYDVRGLAICDVAKNRHGGTKNIALYFRDYSMTFIDHENDYPNPFHRAVSQNLLPYKEEGSNTESNDDDAPF